MHKIFKILSENPAGNGGIFLLIKKINGVCFDKIYAGIIDLVVILKTTHEFWIDINLKI